MATGGDGIEGVGGQGPRCHERHFVAPLGIGEGERHRCAALGKHDLGVRHAGRGAGRIETRDTARDGAGDVLEVDVHRDGRVGGRHDGRGAAGKAIGAHRHHDDGALVEGIGPRERDDAVDGQALPHEVGARERTHFDGGAGHGCGADRRHDAHGDGAAAEQTDAEVGRLARPDIAAQGRRAAEGRVGRGDREGSGIDDRERELAVGIRAREGFLDALGQGLALAAASPVVGTHDDDGVGLEAQRDLARTHRFDAIGFEHDAGDAAGRLQAEVERDGGAGRRDGALARHGLGAEQARGAHGEGTDEDAVERIGAGARLVVAHGEVLHVLELHRNLTARHHEPIAGDADASRQRRVGTGRRGAGALGAQDAAADRAGAPAIRHIGDHRLPIEPHGEGDDVAVAQVGPERRQPIGADAETADAVATRGVRACLPLHADTRVLLLVVAVLEDPHAGVGLRHAVAIADDAGHRAGGRQDDACEDLVARQRQVDGHAAFAANRLADGHELATPDRDVRERERAIGRVDGHDREAATDHGIGHGRTGRIDDDAAHGAEPATEQHRHEGLRIGLQRDAHAPLLETAVVEGVDTNRPGRQRRQAEGALPIGRRRGDGTLGGDRRRTRRIRARDAWL